MDNYASLITTRIYKCSNKQCQDEIDKATKDRKKLQKQQEVAKQNRITAKHNLRLNKRKILR